MSEITASLLGGKFKVAYIEDGRFATSWEYDIVIPRPLIPACINLVHLKDLGIEMEVERNVLFTARLNHRRPKYGNVQQTVLITIKSGSVLTTARYVSYRRQFKTKLFRALNERLKALQSQ
ncbi:hypothetical protein EKK58_08865 [Candidatus Dependentiae bacterium]|nr:MAG: hypothetical protein EKK58_08865 [Candidatus Dependentiae bacterium]